MYRACPVVANICVYADQSQAKPIAIVVPAEPALKTIAKDQGIKGEHLEDLVSNENLIYHVYKQLLDAGEKGGLSGIELIQGVVLADEEWTPQNVSYFNRSCHDERVLTFDLTEPSNVGSKTEQTRDLAEVQGKSRPRLRIVRYGYMGSPVQAE